MNRRDALLQLAALAAVPAVPGLAWAKDPFTVIKPPQQPDDPERIEVIEFFHYGCPHCRNFDPLVKAWAARLPQDVSFRAVPAIWNNAQLAGLARLFYAAQVAGEADRLHTQVFVAVQDEKRSLYAEDEVREWIAGKVSDPAQFMEAYKSFGVNSMLQRADQIGRAMRIQGVPTVVVDGKYATSAALAGSHEEALNVVDRLIERAREERAAG